MSAIQEPPEQETTTAPVALNLAKVLQQMLAVSDKVSDLIFSPGRPPQIELVGKLQPVIIPGVEKLSPAQTSSIAKLIIRGKDRAEVLARARRALEQFIIEGVKTSIPLDRAIINNERFIRGDFSTRFMEEFEWGRTVD